MAKLSNEKIAEIQRLYAEIGIYSQVAKQVGCSPSTVKKYCNLDVVKTNTVKKIFDKEIVKISSMDLTLFLEKSDNLTTLTHEEIENLKELWEEI